MKKTTKFLTLFLSLVLGLNSMVVYGESISDQPAFEEPVSNTAESAAALAADNKEEPEIREEIVEWREEGVRHYYLGNGLYQAVVSPTEVSEFTSSSDSTRDSQNSSGGEDTYISSSSPSTNYGSSNKMWVSNSEIAFFHGYLPVLPENADIVSARMYFSYYFSVSSGNLTVEAYPVQFYWEENTLKWNTAAAYENLGLGSESSGTATLLGTQNITQTHVNITSAVKSWYECKKINDFGIALKRKSGSIASVTLVPREATSGNSPYYEINYTLQNLPVANGTYYVHNYVKEDDNGTATNQDCFLETHGSHPSDTDPDEDSTLTGLNYCEVQLLTGESSQKWVFEYLHNGYYTIKNLTGNMVLAVQEGQENTAGKVIIRETFTGSIRQQWKLIPTDTGALKIKPRSSESYSTDWVMGVSSYVGIGRNVHLLAYNNTDIRYNDEWCLRKVGDDVVMIGVQDTNNGILSSKCFMGILHSTGEMGYTYSLRRKSTFTKDEILDQMEASTIFVSLSHGSVNIDGSSLHISSSGTLLSTTDILYSNGSPKVDLYNCTLILFLACKSAASGSTNSGVSICDAAVTAGAGYVIGFTDSIYCNDANLWAEIFFRYYRAGVDVINCVNHTDNYEIQNADGKYASAYYSPSTIQSSKVCK